MKLPETIRIQIADNVTRIFAIVIILAMLLVIIFIWILGEHQYHRMLPASIAIVAIIPGWLLAKKGKPLIGIWFLLTCIGMGIISGMILSGGVRALSYMAVLFCVTPIVALYGVRGGVIFTVIVLSVGLLFNRLDTLGSLRQVNEPPAAFLLVLIGIYLCIQVGLVWIPVDLMLKALINSERQTQALNQSEERYRSLVENTSDGYFVCEIPSGKFIFLNKPMCSLLGYTMPAAKTLTLWDTIDAGERERMRKNILERFESKAPSFDNSIRNIVRKDGSGFRAEVSTSLVTYKGKDVLQGAIKDITERESLIRQLQQAQRMEAIGQLAGGVAHDYNNMLSVIMGYSDLSLLYTKPGEPLYDNLIEISKAAERSKTVTRQLLAFARKEVIAHQILDLNATIESMLKMIRRLIGENIDLTWRPRAEIGLIRIDPCQIDQILANLCVNARDAITDVGKIAIETSMVTFDENFCSEHAGFVPGDFVMLAVTDNGCGMDKKTRMLSCRE